ncbi:PREDICTED: putative gustatory receptor 98b [Rhagoletis zephyria]|uniref:putative gustatory receptor 98b n=1 Tax=Rhagoletis zephyria TaxID=28612 RepID=UPI00081161A8|nr:PREDICTED: putative gustatory receptor 98b [Rhagoletis zephyria]
MRPVKFSESSLVVAATPYLRAFSFCTVVMPPYFTLRSSPTYRSWLLHLLRTFFILYILVQFVISFWIAQVNNEAIRNYVDKHSTDSITKVLSTGITIAQVTVQAAICIQTLTGCQLLRNIFISIVHLEWDVRQHYTDDWPLSALRRRLCLRSGLWLLVVCTIVPYLSYQLTNTTISPIERVITVYFGTLVQVKSVEYCVNVQLVQELLRLVQRQLLHLRRELVRCEEMESRWTLYADLHTNQQLLARVWNLLNKVERYFCIPMLMLFFYNGFSITQAIHWAYINFEQDDLNTRLCRIIYTVMVIVMLFMPCYQSQCCIDEYNHFGTMLHKLKTVGIDESLSMRLQEYSLQLMHQQMLFTCGGFFEINLKNFGAIILTITTYVVILIQFKLQAETEKKTDGRVRFE